MNKMLSFTLFLLILIILESNIFSADKPNIAIAEFAARNVSEVDAVAISDIIRIELVRINQFNIIERKNMESILKEQMFQLQGCTDQECAVKMGRILNANLMVIGTVFKIEQIYHITADIINVETGKIERSERVQCNRPQDIFSAAEAIAILLSGGKQARERINSFQIQVNEVIDNKRVVINKGSIDNITKKSIYKVFDEDFIETGYLKIIETKPNTSIAEVLKSKKQIQTGYPLKYNSKEYGYGIGMYLTTYDLLINLNIYDKRSHSLEINLGAVHGESREIVYSYPCFVKWYLTDFYNDISGYLGIGLSMVGFYSSDKTFASISPVLNTGIIFFANKLIHFSTNAIYFINTSRLDGQLSSYLWFNCGISIHY
ncbi:MAG: CsgG/HfaB family protein [Elusimicrobiota bacterium]